MKEMNTKTKSLYYVGLISGFLAIICCLTTIGLSVVDSYVAVYMLASALFFLVINRVFFHLSIMKQDLLINMIISGFIALLALFVGLTKINIYFLISSMFGYSLAIIASHLLLIKSDHSRQSIVYNILFIGFSFLFSFVFFFPAIYEKHATSVSNSNFIVLCYSVAVLISASKNVLFPFHKTLKLNVIESVFKKSLVKEIVLGLLIIIILCSLYFTTVEPDIKSYVDSLWYSFSVITTIGFGDIYVTTTFGRILSVILGICGIIFVALFTSIIVNFYHEMNQKREEREIRKIMDKIQILENIEKERQEEKKD